MDYIFIHEKQDAITEESDKIKNSNEKRKVSARKWRPGDVKMNLFLY